MPTAPVAVYNNLRLEPYIDPEEAREITVNLPASVSYAKGTLLGELTATPGTYKAYAAGNTDGSQAPKVILAYAASTDAAGNATWGGSDFGETRRAVPAFYCGTFRSEDLVGLDAGAVTAMGARLVSGTITSGTLHLG